MTSKPGVVGNALRRVSAKPKLYPEAYELGQPLTHDEVLELRELLTQKAQQRWQNGQL